MANKAWAAVKLTGGTDGALDDIIHTNLTNGDIGLVLDSATELFYVFYYNSSSALAEDVTSPVDQLVVRPDSNAGNGRWLGVTAIAAKWENMRDFLNGSTLGGALGGIGLQYDHIWIPAQAMNPALTNGPSPAVQEETGGITRAYLAFDAATDESAYFDMVMPSAWDRGTVKARFHWVPTSAATAAQDCYWGMDAVAVSDGDSPDATVGTSQLVADTVQAAVEDDLHISDATPSITVNGTPALRDQITFRVFRDADNGSDNMAGDAWLYGVQIEIIYLNEVSAW